MHSSNVGPAQPELSTELSELTTALHSFITAMETGMRELEAHRVKQSSSEEWAVKQKDLLNNLYDTVLDYQPLVNKAALCRQVISKAPIHSEPLENLLSDFYLSLVKAIEIHNEHEKKYTTITRNKPSARSVNVAVTNHPKHNVMAYTYAETLQKTVDEFSTLAKEIQAVGDKFVFLKNSNKIQMLTKNCNDFLEKLSKNVKIAQARNDILQKDIKTLPTTFIGQSSVIEDEKLPKVLNTHDNSSSAAAAAAQTKKYEFNDSQDELIHYAETPAPAFPISFPLARSSSTSLVHYYRDYKSLNIQNPSVHNDFFTHYNGYTLDKKVDLLLTEINELLALIDLTKTVNTDYIKYAQNFIYKVRLISRLCAETVWKNPLDRVEAFNNLNEIFEIVEDYGWNISSEADGLIYNKNAKKYIPVKKLTEVAEKDRIEKIQMRLKERFENGLIGEETSASNFSDTKQSVQALLEVCKKLKSNTASSAAASSSANFASPTSDDSKFENAYCSDTDSTLNPFAFVSSNSADLIVAATTGDFPYKAFTFSDYYHKFSAASSPLAASVAVAAESSNFAAIAAAVTQSAVPAVSAVTAALASSEAIAAAAAAAFHVSSGSSVVSVASSPPASPRAANVINPIISNLDELFEKFILRILNKGTYSICSELVTALTKYPSLATKTLDKNPRDKKIDYGLTLLTALCLTATSSYNRAENLKIFAAIINALNRTNAQHLINSTIDSKGTRRHAYHGCNALALALINSNVTFIEKLLENDATLNCSKAKLPVLLINAERIKRQMPDLYKNLLEKSSILQRPSSAETTNSSQAAAESSAQAAMANSASSLMLPSSSTHLKNNKRKSRDDIDNDDDVIDMTQVKRQKQINNIFESLIHSDVMTKDQCIRLANIAYSLHSQLTDSFSTEILNDPVILVETGLVHERASLKQWLGTNLIGLNGRSKWKNTIKKDPISGLTINDDSMVECHTSRKLLLAYGYQPKSLLIDENIDLPSLITPLDMTQITQSIKRKIIVADFKAKIALKLERQGIKISLKVLDNEITDANIIEAIYLVLSDENSKVVNTLSYFNQIPRTPAACASAAAASSSAVACVSDQPEKLMDLLNECFCGESVMSDGIYESLSEEKLIKLKESLLLFYRTVYSLISNSAGDAMYDPVRLDNGSVIDRSEADKSRAPALPCCMQTRNVLQELGYSVKTMQSNLQICKRLTSEQVKAIKKSLNLTVNDFYHQISLFSGLAISQRHDFIARGVSEQFPAVIKAIYYLCMSRSMSHETFVDLTTTVAMDISASSLDDSLNKPSHGNGAFLFSSASASASYVPATAAAASYIPAAAAASQSTPPVAAASYTPSAASAAYPTPPAAAASYVRSAAAAFSVPPAAASSTPPASANLNSPALLNSRQLAETSLNSEQIRRFNLFSPISPSEMANATKFSNMQFKK